VGSTTLLHPVFNNLEQVITFRRVGGDDVTSCLMSVTNLLFLMLFQ
jgi:hypothetical protein